MAHFWLKRKGPIVPEIGEGEFVTKEVLTNSRREAPQGRWLMMRGSPYLIPTIPKKGYRRIAPVWSAVLQGDPGSQYFADRMTHALIAGVAKTGSVRAISEFSSCGTREPAKPLTQVAPGLNVDETNRAAATVQASNLHRVSPGDALRTLGETPVGTELIPLSRFCVCQQAGTHDAKG